jgi:hypothetical protein
MCPFRAEPPKNGGVELFHGLHPERVEEIAHSLLREDSVFHCHKTVAYDDETGDGRVVEGTQVCAGAVATMLKGGELFNNVAFRLGAMAHMFEPEDFDHENAPVYGSITEWVKALTDRYNR